MTLIYISSLNADDTLDQAGFFTGADIPVLPTNSTHAHGGIADAHDAQDMFKFFTTPLENDANSAANVSDAANANFGVLPKVNNAIFLRPEEQTAAWDNTNKHDKRTALQEMNLKLASAVFGSPDAVDLFSNTIDIMTSTDASIGNCVTQVNTNIDTAPVTELFNYLIRHKAERFALSYNATVAAGTADPSMTSVYKNVHMVCQGGATAIVDVHMSNATTVSKIMLVSSPALILATLDESAVCGHAQVYGGSEKLVVKLVLDAAWVAAINDSTVGEVTLGTSVISATGALGIYTGLSAVGSLAGAGAIVTAAFASSSAVASIWVTTVSVTPFARDEAVTITDDAYGTTVTLPMINSVGAAMLNGTLSDAIIGTPAPLEAGDILGCVFSIKSADGQLNPIGNVVTTTGVTLYKFKIGFTPSADPDILLRFI